MATTISIESAPGNATYVDLTNYLIWGSLTVKFNTIDFQLKDPPAGACQLTSAVKLTDPAWTGTVAAVATSDVVDLRVSHVFFTATATNTKTLPTDTAPFDLSDVPGGPASGDYLLEDSSGHYMLEDGTDWAPGALLLEQALSRGYRHLSVQTRTQTSGPNLTLGRTEVVSPGLRPGNVFALTSLNQGYAAASYQITQVTSQWPALSTAPQFSIEFGNTPQTLADWTAAHVTPAPVVAPPVTVPSGPIIYGSCSSTTGLQTMGGGIVTVGSASFSVSAPGGHTLTCQVLGAIDARMDAWDNYVPVSRRGVRAVLSGGIYTGAWQELPFGLARATYDLSSGSGIALASGTYTVSIQINTVEYNQMRIYSGWAQVAVTVV
jgi:hypothetical protein